MPVLALIRHLALVYTDLFSARVTVFCVVGLVTGAAVRSTLSHDVTLPTQCCFTLKTTEMLHVPVSPFCLRALISQNYLVAGLAARLQPLGVVPATVDLSVLEEVDQIHQQLTAGGALEALGVPAAAVPCPAGEHCNVAAGDLSAALLTDGSRHSDWEESDDTSSQILPFPLLTKQPQLLLLLII